MFDHICKEFVTSGLCIIYLVLRISRISGIVVSCLLFLVVNHFDG